MPLSCWSANGVGSEWHCIKYLMVCNPAGKLDAKDCFCDLMHVVVHDMPNIPFSFSAGAIKSRLKGQHLGVIDDC